IIRSGSEHVVAGHGWYDPTTHACTIVVRRIDRTLERGRIIHRGWVVREAGAVHQIAHTGARNVRKILAPDAADLTRAWRWRWIEHCDHTGSHAGQALSIRHGQRDLVGTDIRE